MDFGPQGITYFPTLGIRPAEMRALEELPERTKDRLRPIILFSPWVGSKQLEKSTERLHDAFGDRPFYLELDGAYTSNSADRPAVVEFFDLLEGEDDCDSYYDLVEGTPSAIPVLRIENGQAASTKEQLDRINEIDRGFMVRVRMGAFDSGDISALDPLFQLGLSNYIVAADCEWSLDMIACEEWVRRIIDQFIANDISVPVITSHSSFPKNFSDIDGVRVIPIASRVLFDNVRRRYGNQLEIFYGDWATTKPRENTIARTPAARIDYVVNGSWVIHRRKDEWDYLDAANALIQSSYWQGQLEIWGNLMVEKTANGDVTGITSPSKNVAARVNLHLHQQAWFDDPNAMLDTDDPWDDDL